MLVLSRRPGEKILFPGLGMSLEVLRSRGSVVRLGIEAPSEIAIIRGEIQDEPHHGHSPQTSTDEKTKRHEFRNQLNQLTLKLELLRRQLEVGHATDPDRTLEEAISDLSALEQHVEDKKVTVDEARRLRVLIVEDQDNERELMAGCLRLSGMFVETVGNGAEALEYLNSHELPDLVLLDMRMPGIDGPTLIETVRHDERLSGLRVFAVSGSPKAEFPSTASSVDGWFSKPVRVDALLQAAQMDRSPVHTTA